MNNKTYRLVYSKARNMWVAASESAKSASNAGRSEARRSRGLPRRGAWYAKWTIIATLVALLGIIPQAHAQIVAAPGGATQVTQTRNGLPQVNIARPSGAGVSVNRYQQFDVPKPGVILNNASGIVATQQAGVINGNPNLAGGPGARLIINQVESQNPTYLRGFVEIAGSRADVVVANAAGIVVNGGGFINTSRATLTTGQPLLGPDGQLTGFNVNRGLITVEGAGLNASNVNQVDLIARAVKANAAIFADRLNVVTGANHVDHGTLAATPIVGEGAAPGVSIDVAQLGGMYANRIVLVGTEKGVGVNSAGVIGAQAGDLTLTTEGKLVLKGKTQTAGRMTLSAAQIENSGITYGQQQITVTATDALTNTGTLAAAKDLVVSAGRIDSHGALGAGVQQDGSLGRTGDLHLSSTGVLRAAGKQLAGGNAEMTGASLDLSGADTATYGAARMRALAGDMNLTGAKTHAQGPIEASAGGAIVNDRGALSSQSGITVTGQRLSNAAGQMWAGQALTAHLSGELANQGGTLGADGAMQLHAASIFNSQGTVQSGKSLQIYAADFENLAGRIVALGSEASLLSVTGKLRNGAGKTASGALGGIIGSRGALTVTARELTNDGAISALRDLTLHTSSLQNTGGQLASEGSLTLTSDGALRNLAGGRVSGRKTTVTAGAFENSGNAQLSGTQLALHADEVNNQGGHIGSLAGSTGDVEITSHGRIDNSGGTIDATRHLTVASATLSGAGSFRAARSLTVKLASDLTVSAGQRFEAGDALIFSLPGTLHNQGTLFSSNRLRIDARDIVNSGAMTAGGLLSSHSNTLANTGAIVGASVELAADASITNAGSQALIGATDARGQLTLLAREIENRDDTTATDTQAKTSVYGAGDIVLAGSKDASGGYSKAARVLNQSGLIESGRHMRILAAQMLNTRRVLLTSGYTTQVDPALLKRLGISLSGMTGQVDVRDPHAIGGVYVEPPHGGQWNSNYIYTSYTGKAEINRVSAISPKAQLQVGGDLDLSGVDRFENRWSQVSAGGNIKAPVVLDMQSWKGQQAPRIRVTYSGHYHYNNYDNSEHDWTIPFGDAPFIGSRPGGYEQKAPADIREFDLPGYESVFRGNMTLTGTGVSINNTAGNHSLPTTGLPAGSVLDGHWRADPAIARASALNVLAQLSLPTDGMFSRTTSPEASYLVETNPAFTSAHAFISSDYYFKQIGWDPSHIEKRLGDGFYEQRLVRDQISSLTGRARLGQYSDLEAQFQALMASGAKLVRALHLAPGIGLSAEQVARLTHSVVIMETRTVDGQHVLVPVVYLASTDIELLGNGPVIAARDVDLKGVNSFANSGMVKADRSMSIDAQAINNRDGRLESGGQMTLATRGDMDLTSTQLKAGSLRLDAGRALILDTAATTVDQHGADGAFRRTTTLGPRTSIDVTGDAAIRTGGNVSQRAADLSVGGNLRTDIGGDWALGTQQTGEKKVVARANGISDTDVNEAHGSTLHVGGKSDIAVGKDFTARGARIALDGGGAIKAGGNLMLDAARTTSTINSSSAGGDRTGDYAETLHQSDRTLLATTLKSGKGLAITSGQDITVKGSSVSLDTGKLALDAARDVTIGAATETHELNAHETHTHDGMVSSRREASGIDAASTLSIGSTLSGDSVALTSGRDIRIAGSNVVATDDVSLHAKRDVHIVSAQDTSRSATYHDKEESGLLSGGGLSVTVGSRAQSDKARTASVVSHGSVVGSLKGDVTITAGNTLEVRGSDLMAGNNLAATAKSIAIGTATEEDHRVESHEMRQSGVTVGVQTMGLDALQNTVQQTKGATGSGDGRVQALRGMAAASAAYDAAKTLPGELSGLAKGEMPEVKVTVSVGGSRSKSTSSEDSAQQRGSHVAAGNTMLLRATGDKSQGQGDVTIVGSDVDAQ
ncbi:MAG: hemagglutinin repeat-containing protein, partial [Pandoraea sp.]